METEERTGPGRGVLLSLGLIGIIVGAALVGEFALRLQPGLGGNTSAAAGVVIMPSGVGSNTQLNFAPAVVTAIIGLNNTIIFENRDSVVHTVTATDRSFDSGDIKPGGQWSKTFTTPGNYSYYCIYHTGWMKGTVVVKSGTGAGIFTVKIPSGVSNDQSLNYSPSSLTLVVGVNNTVVFVNQDNTKHTVTANDGTFDSGDILPGQSWSYTFAAGTYSFHCVYHSWMQGTIVVKAP